ncbi:hypothetical protein VIBNIMADA3021_1130089 [Vibrio nigripulchritudo MADA3021]|nr:hypothetical protein VIBNIMADA3021_1130089 [Vibrio nigripulchritudo MADA3021]
MQYGHSLKRESREWHDENDQRDNDGDEKLAILAHMTTVLPYTANAHIMCDIRKTVYGVRSMNMQTD